jgi:hypothetical protein
MNTPKDENFDTIIEEFNQVLSKMGPGMGDPVTRAERALLKTFHIFLTARAQQDEEASAADTGTDAAHESR